MSRADMQFAIVEFFDGLQIIPSKWFVDESQGEAFFPSYSNDKRYYKAVEAVEDPQKGWLKHPIKKVWGYARNMERGREKLKEVEFFSDINTEPEETEKKKRRERAAYKIRERKIRERKLSSDSEERIDSSSDENSLAPFPSFSDTELNEGTQSVKSAGTVTRVAEQLEGLDGNNGKCGDKKGKKDQAALKKRRLSSNEESSGSLSFDIVNSAPSSSLLSRESEKANSSGNADILRLLTGLGVKLNTIISTQKEIMTRLDRLEKKVGGGYADEGREDHNHDMSELFPLMSLKDVETFEEKLKVEKERRRMVVDHLKTIGGRDIRNAIFRMMPYLLGNEVAALYSWKGGKGKMIFCQLQLCKIIIDVTRQQFNATEHETSEPVKKWLAKAKERIERGKKKAMSQPLQNGDSEENN
ncbi:uncharacterized protein LOC124170333 [Ischnura elegans]|uniref:uncharacterized protein LOC124170333 n=1 Tax=Ischnura elegans TaxID=197161 RepID=UPI001ED87DDC|nr:uncharacterized protein LOC124170333 [Ischnura elegans]